jgi:hypothetical protein
VRLKHNHVLLVVITAVAFFVGVAVGGYLFHDSQPRSFLAIQKCGNNCYRRNDLAGLLASAGIQRAPGLIPNVVKESDKCIVIQHPFPEMRHHLVFFPKKDIKNIADVSIEDQPYVIACIALIRSLIMEEHLSNYRVVVNGPGLQDITYLHFHLKARSE